MKTIIVTALIVVGIIVATAGAKEPPPIMAKDTVVNLGKLFPYNVVILERCRYITYRISPTQRGLVHAGSCKNPVHSIYGRIASHAG